MSPQKFDIVIVGGGIIGLTVAHELKQRQPDLKITILEKEKKLGCHASGRNSGVLHTGIYYSSDTLKARFCARGAAKMIAYSQENNIACNQDGKVIVATHEQQIPALEQLLINARDNKINAEKISTRQLLELEPYAAPGFGAIHCRDTAVINSQDVIANLQRQLTDKGVAFQYEVTALGRNTPHTLSTSKGMVSYDYLFNCAGAYSDRLAKTFGLAKEYTLVPFKGIYWKLSRQRNPHIRASIYPVPDISLPFLGVHLTRVISGDVYVGPTAIPAFGRENYGLLRGAKPLETLEIGKHLTAMYWRNQQHFRHLVHTEMTKYSKARFLLAAQKLCPSLKSEDLVPTTKTGIRPQLINLRTAQLEMDFLYEKTEESLHILNSISPAFTSSFAVAEMIVDESGVAS